MRKNIQIPQRLFCQLVLYVMDHEDREDPRYKAIMAGVEEKFNALRRHELYSRYKSSIDANAREKARQDYLDDVGIPPAFRW